jgi:hypothetical protein
MVTNCVLGTNCSNPQDCYSYRVLGTIMGNDGEFHSYYSDNTIYDFLIRYRGENLDYTGTARTWEHLPLIYEILHGTQNSSFTPINDNELEYYLTELDTAHKFNTKTVGDVTDIWGSDNRLEWPIMPNGHKDKIGRYYSHTDYMLLHNLFWLTYINNPRYINFDNSIYPSNGTGTNINPTTVYSPNRIVSTATVNSNGGLIEHANRMVTLNPGFNVANGGTYSGYVDNGSETFIDYIIPPADPTNGGQVNLDFTCTANSDAERIPIKSDNENTIDTTKSVLAVHTIATTSHISICPNPANERIFVNGISNFDVNILDLSGKKVLQFYNANYSIDISGLSSGIYLIVIKGTTQNYVQKFIKN